MIKLSLLKTIKRSSYFLIGIATGQLNVACNSLPLGQTTRATGTSRDSLAFAARRCWNGVTSHMYAPLVTACPQPSHMGILASGHITDDNEHMLIDYLDQSCGSKLKLAADMSACQRPLAVQHHYEN